MSETINNLWGLACRMGLHGYRRTIRGYRRGCTECAQHLPQQGDDRG